MYPVDERNIKAGWILIGCWRARILSSLAIETALNLLQYKNAFYHLSYKSENVPSIHEETQKPLNTYAIRTNDKTQQRSLSILKGVKWHYNNLQHWSEMSFKCSTTRLRLQGALIETVSHGVMPQLCSSRQQWSKTHEDRSDEWK